MKAKALLILAVLMISSMFALTMVDVNAVSVLPPPTPNPQVVYTSVAAANSLLANPEYLKVRTVGTIHTTTTIIVQGTDENGQPIQASVTIPGGTSFEQQLLLNDTISKKPVTFATINSIIQQNGTHNDQFQLWTQPEPYTNIHYGWAYPTYLGEYHLIQGVGWQPGLMAPAFDSNYIDPLGHQIFVYGNYLIGQGPGTHPLVSKTPPEPSNPDPLVVYINWIDQIQPNLGDLIPEGDSLAWGAQNSYGSSELGPTATAQFSTVLWIEGLDQAGNKLIGTCTITQYDIYDTVVTPNGATFAVVCNVWGGVAGESYYIMTNPTASRQILTYTVMIDHVNLYPHSYDILASGPGPLPTVGGYPITSAVRNVNTTIITAVLMDADNNVVHSSSNTQPVAPSLVTQIFLNFYTSGGSISPGEVVMGYLQASADANLTSDTNARTIKVVVDAVVPACTAAPALNLRSYVEVTEDGVNSALSTGWPIHQLMWGYNDTANPAGVNLPATPKPPLEELGIEEDPAEVGDPDTGGLGRGEEDYGIMNVALDGPIYEIAIPLYQGCNLISSPVHPLLGSSTEYPGGTYYSPSWPTLPLHAGIPMSLLFSSTEAQLTIDSVWWYDAVAGVWHFYVPAMPLLGDGPGAMFKGGVGYWIKVEKPCTLELSGVIMENAPFTPSSYIIANGKWNLLGFTSVVPLTLATALEGMYATNTATSVGRFNPVWVWDAKLQVWTRDPASLWPTQGFWTWTTGVLLAY